MLPKLAVFPKCFMDELCIDKTMTVIDWIELSATLGVAGLEFYSGFLDDNEPFLQDVKSALKRHNLQMPMLCCSPDLTETDPVRLQKEIDHEKRMIEITAFFEGQYCRVLSGQRRPQLTQEAGIAQVVRIIRELLPFAEEHRVVLTMENHYKDNYWQYPEFAQKMNVFCAIVDQIESPWFGVNYDPSNAILAGEDPLALLDRVKHRVVSMHASDRFLKTGTLENLRKEESSIGYASRLAHGVIGEGMNDYDTIFSVLRSVGFASWISIEDGMNGMDDLRKSVRFLKTKISEHFAK
jgi:sugar phosphate isomerase/epimerase